MQEESTFKIKSLKKLGIKKDPIIDSNGEVIQPGSRILKGYWGDWIVFGSKVPGYTLKLKIRMTPSGSKIRLINPLMTPDNNWENRKTSVRVEWGDGKYDLLYKKKINTGRFNRTSPYTLEHNYTAEVGDEMWLTITSIEPLVPYGCEIVEMLGQFPYDRYDLNMDRDGHYCGLFGVDQYVEEYPELNKLYGAGRTITKVSAELLDNWRDTLNMDRMFEGWGITEVPNNFFKWQTKFHPDSPDNTPQWQMNNMIVDTCKSYYRTFADCPNLVSVPVNLLGNTGVTFTTTQEMFSNCPKLTNTLGFSSNNQLTTAEKMYYGCKSLTKIVESFLSSELPKLVNTNSMFEDCPLLGNNLADIDFSKFMARAINLQTARYMFKNSGLVYLGLILGFHRNLRDITGIYMGCTKALTLWKGMFTAETAADHTNDETQENKLIIAHMFDGAGDPTTGLAVPEALFHYLGTRSGRAYSALGYDCSYIFHNATIRRIPEEVSNDEYRLEFLFGGLFNANDRDFKYDASHLMDGVTIKHSWITVPHLYWASGLEKLDYAFANSKWDHLEKNFIMSNDIAENYKSLKSMRGLFAGSEINFRFPETVFNREYKKFELMSVEDYSEMFMNVTYKWSEHPIDYVVATSASFCDMSRMFKGSNITTYRPIHWRSNERCTYDMTDFVDHSLSAPKEWILDGYTDRSTWDPTVVPKPFIMWVNTDSIHRTVTLAGDATVSINWGDGSTDKGLANGNMTHTYSSSGNFKISVVSTKAHQPDKATMERIFRVDGEIPYGTELDLSQDLPEFTNNPDRFMINYVGPRVAALCKHVTLSCQGYISPMLLKYGSNSSYREGLKFLDIIDPMDPTITFSADFVIVDKTVTMDVEFTNIPFLIGEQTAVELTIGQVRVDNDLLHVDFTNCTPRNIPLDFWRNCIGHKFNKFDRVKMLDVGYLRPDHFKYGYGSILDPSIKQEDIDREAGIRIVDLHTSNKRVIDGKEYLTSEITFGRNATETLYSMPQLLQPDHIKSYMCHTAVYRFHPALSIDTIYSIDSNSIISHSLSVRGYENKDDAVPYQGLHDDHYPHIEEEFMTFVLENVDDVITPYNLHVDNPKYADRTDVGTTTVEIIDPNGELDETVDMVDEIVPLKKITAEKIVLRIKAKYPVWLSENVRSKIVAVYGIINNIEGDFILDHRFAIGTDSFKPLAPNIKWVGESIFWGLHNTGFEHTFDSTKLEVIPPALFAYSKADSFIGCFANTPVKRVPDYLWVNNTYDEIYTNKLDLTDCFANCPNIESVFTPVDNDSISACVVAKNMYNNGAKTYAYKSSTNIESDFFSKTYVWNPKTYSSRIAKMPLNSNLPELTHDNLVAINRESSADSVLVSVNTTIAIDPRKIVDKWHCMDYLMWCNVPRYDFNTTTVSTFNYTNDQYNIIFKYLHSIRGFGIYENNRTGLVQIATDVHPDHFMLLNNENVVHLCNVFAGVEFNYTPNAFFINQWKMVDATGLLLRSRFDKIPEPYIAPPTHLSDYLGRPIYIGGETNAFRWHPRPLDKMLRYRNNWLNITYLLNSITEGDLTCPTFTKHRVIDAHHAFHNATTMVTDETFIDIDRESNVYKQYLDDIATKGIFWRNTSITTDCRIFHIWKEVPNDGSAYEFQETTQLLHPPKDMFDALTRLTKLEETFRGSNIRDLPNCNPRIQEYPYFAAESKISLIPEHWFKYSGTNTLDIRYAFNNCTGLIITHKIMDPAITVPVVKYASLENAWSIIGDDDVIFAGINTKLDGTDRSLVKIIPEEDLFRQTIDVHDARWTLSVKALGMETIGNEPVDDGNLFMVSWGDGSDPSVVSYREMEWEDYSHKYESSGRYQVMILSTQWCCYINSPQDMSSKYTTYSIDGMLQNSTCRAICDYGLTNMFGFTVEKVFDTMFDRLDDVTTVSSLPKLLYEFKKLKAIPEQILWKMSGLTELYAFAMYSAITTLPAKLFSKNPKLRNLNSVCERCPNLNIIPEGLFDNNPALETIDRGFCDIMTLTEAPRNLFAKNPNLISMHTTFSQCNNMVMDNTYDNFLAAQTKLVDGAALFLNWIIKELPPNLLNRCTSLRNVEQMFTLTDFNPNNWNNIDDTRWKWFNDMANRDNSFEIPANWLPKSVNNTSGMFFFRTKLTAYPSDLFTGNTVLNSAAGMFMNTGIRRIHNETFKTMSHTNALNLELWIYKDKRFGKSFYIHYCPKVVSSAINVPLVRTESMLLGTFGTMTEAQLFSGVKTDPSNIHSLYVQEFEPATYKLKMTGDGTFITMKAITKSDVVFTDLTMIEWGDGTDDLYEHDIKKADLQATIKHVYKKPGEYTIKVGAKYCLVPIIDTLPEAYQVNALTILNDQDEVKQVSIGGEYGIGSVDIKADRILVNYPTPTDVEVSLVPRPYYVGEIYTVDVTVEPKGLKVGEQTTVELDIVRDTSDPFERLEIGGTLGVMEGYTEFPRVYQVPELQYKKWVGTEIFFTRNTQITSLDRSFMNLPFEFRISDKTFWGLTELTYASHAFWNTNMVIEPGFAPDFNNCKKLSYVNSTFRTGLDTDIGNESEEDPYIPTGTPLNKITWKVNQTQYQPFSSLASIVDYGYIHYHSDITYVMTTNFSKTTNLQAAYNSARSLSWLPADFFRTLNTTSDVNALRVFTDTPVTTIQPASDGKTLLDFPIGANRTLTFNLAFANCALTGATIIDALNKSSFINTTVAGAVINLSGMFTWNSRLESFDASALKLNIPSRTGTLDLRNLFSRDNTPNNDIDITMMYNIKPGAITIAASGSPNVIVDNMFDHCYADVSVSDAHECFIVTGDDSNFNKAKALADKSALNTLTVMTTTVVPK